MTYINKRLNVILKEAEHMQVISLLQKENYSNNDFEKLVKELLMGNFKRVNNIRR